VTVVSGTALTFAPGQAVPQVVDPACGRRRVSTATKSSELEPVSALVVTTDAILRGLVVEQLSRMRVGVVLEAETVAEARARLQVARRCDVAVLDLEVFGVRMLGLAEDLARGHGRVVGLIPPDRPELVQRAIHSGVSSFVSKARPDIPTLTGDPAGAGLTFREAEVLALLAEGNSNRQISRLLGLSESTVRSHLLRAGRKFGNGDRANMVLKALRAGVIT
jgi:DNA-binding NarL/FixJ family response regulator